MMKKQLIVFIILVSILQTSIIVESSQVNYSSNTILENIQTNHDILEILYPVMETPIYFQEQSQYQTTILTDTPAQFSWRDYNGKDLTTSAKNQGRCGSCWAFGAMGAIESVINIHEGFKDIDLDLSEQYMLSCVPSAGSCNGGRTASPFSFIIDTTEEGNNLNGVIFEECLPYEADDSIPCADKTENWMETLVPLSGFGELWFGPNNPDAEEIIKSKIYENGPVYALMFVDDAFRNFGSVFHRTTDYFRYRPINVDYLNHAILIVGWNDDESIRNGGYWICKNSWDTNWGYDGFFNIEYGAQNIQHYIAWPEYDPASFNCPPVSDAGGFYRGDPGEEIIFDASDSFDAEDESLHYAWNVGNDITYQGISPTHSFQDPGLYPVQLTVTDENNKSSTDQTVVCIHQEPIMIDISGDFGIIINIRNQVDWELIDTTITIDIIGSYQNMDHRVQDIKLIPSDDIYEMILPIVGFGKGIIHIDYENIEVTKEFFSIGPFVLMK